MLMLLLFPAQAALLISDLGFYFIQGLERKKHKIQLKTLPELR